MSMVTKKEVFQEHLEQYLKASKQEKGGMLDHVCFITGMKRKSAIRRFRQLKLAGPAPPHKRGRRTVYGPDVTAALRIVWEAGNEVCGQRDGMWPHPPGATKKLRAMSESTVKRRVGGFLKARRRKKVGLSHFS